MNAKRPKGRQHSICGRMLLAVATAAAAVSAFAAAPTGEPADTIAVPQAAEQAAPADTMPARRSFGRKFVDYFRNANKVNPDKKFDFSILGGPHYNSSTQLGLGIVAAGRYRTNRADTLVQPSNVSLFGDVSTVGFYLLGVRGLHIFRSDKYRIDYTLYFFSFPSKFWGIGFDNGDNDDNESDMKRWQAQTKASFLVRLADGLYVGPLATFDYVRGYDIDRPELLNGMDKETTNFGLGLSVVYDTRDVTTNPSRGVYISAEETFRPRFLGNDYAFSTTELHFSGYAKAWRSAIVAGDLRSQLNFGNPSWGMMAQLGGPYAMRGYYQGRYRDKHKIEAQVELRQHIWKRHGAVAWVGVGTVFDKFSSISTDKLLPNFGIGYRWEFKKNMNVRLDYGFGKSGQSSFMFNINEAF